MSNKFSSKSDMFSYMAYAISNFKLKDMNGAEQKICPTRRTFMEFPLSSSLVASGKNMREEPLSRKSKNTFANRQCQSTVIGLMMSSWHAIPRVWKPSWKALHSLFAAASFTPQQSALCWASRHVDLHVKEQCYRFQHQRPQR